MPREVMRYESQPRGIDRTVQIYRLVDPRPLPGDCQHYGVIERLSHDAMGAESWVRVEAHDDPDVVWDLLAALAESNIEKLPVTFAVKTHDTAASGIADGLFTGKDMTQFAREVARAFASNLAVSSARVQRALSHPTPEHIEEEDDGA